MRIFGRYTNIVNGQPRPGFMRRPKTVYNSDVTEEMLATDPHYLAYCRLMLITGGKIVKMHEGSSNEEVRKMIADISDPRSQNWNPKWRDVWDVEEKKWNFAREIERFHLSRRFINDDWEATFFGNLEKTYRNIRSKFSWWKIGFFHSARYGGPWFGTLRANIGFWNKDIL